MIFGGFTAALFLLRAPLLFFWQKTNDVVLSVNSGASDEKIVINSAPKPSDIENQRPLQNPPNEIKALYATSFSASSQTKIKYLMELLKTTELNAVVIDIKTFDGYVAYDIKNELIEKYGAKEIRIPKINSLIKKLHDDGIYVIARIAVFQDPVLATARPDLAIHRASKLPKEFASSSWVWSSSTLWHDNKKLAWIDPAAKEAWDYNIAIAKDAAERGFDEINFDYIRFASDGDLKDMAFPFYNQKKISKQKVIKSFFEYLRKEMAGIKISADLFGLTTVNKDDMGIGQIIENAYANFDYVAPMVYPSHYFSGFLNYKNPALFPYEVVRYSMDKALARLLAYSKKQIIKNSSSTVNGQMSKVKLRPWLQDFDLGASYNADKVKQEIRAVYDSASSTPELINGFMLWNPSNVYTEEALMAND